MAVNKPPPESSRVTLECSPKEKRIIDLMRRMDFGEIRVVIQDGNPIRIEEIKKSIKL